MNQDIQVLRELAQRYAPIANHEKNAQTIKLHKAVNDLHMERPIVLIDEVPWNEMNFDGSLDLLCQDPYLQSVERKMRRTIYQWTYFPADMVVLPYIGVEKVVRSTGIGVEVKDETKMTEKDNNVVSHMYENQFESEEDLDKLMLDHISYDETETLRRYELLANAIGDIIPVKIIGVDTGYGIGCITWDIIATLMGINDLLYNMIDEPEFMHALVEKLTVIFMDQIRQYEELNLFNSEASLIHCASTFSDDLAKNPLDPDHVTAKNMWGRGLAQILETVSPAMHDEFDIEYMVRALAPFGLNYYGCCEALHHKIDILHKIPNLRKIAISPWADVDIAAQSIGKRYVLSAKPNPSIVAPTVLDMDAATAEMTRIFKACRQNNCHTEILMKDISTVSFRPENLFEWEKMAMRLAQD